MFGIPEGKETMTLCTRSCTTPHCRLYRTPVNRKTCVRCGQATAARSEALLDAALADSVVKLPA